MDDGHREQKNGALELTDIIVDRIKKLAELHEAKILTDEEFTAKKAELLSAL